MRTFLFLLSFLLSHIGVIAQGEIKPPTSITTKKTKKKQAQATADSIKKLRIKIINQLEIIEHLNDKQGGERLLYTIIEELNDLASKDTKNKNIYDSVKNRLDDLRGHFRYRYHEKEIKIVIKKLQSINDNNRT